MNYKVKENIDKLKIRLNNPFYENSFFIMLTSVTSSFIGFIFWIVAAKLYSAEYVGISTALISALTLLGYMSLLGFDQSIIRFFPEMNKNKILSTSLIMSILSATLFSFIFLLCIDFCAPNLSIIKENMFIFYIFLVVYTLSLLTGNAFIALRKSKYYFLQNFVMGSRLVLLVPFVILGTIGIFFSFGISYFIAIILSIFLLFKFGFKPTQIDKEFLRNSFHFSAGIYVFSLLLMVPGQLLSIIILNTLGAEQTAYYYISVTIYSVLVIIPSSFGTSILVEGSHGESLSKNVLKAIRAIYALLIPAGVIFYFFGEFLLGLIGHSYLAAINLFRFMVLSSFFAVFLHVFIAIKKVHKDMKSLILIGTIYCILLIGTSYILMLKIGLIGVGYAWLVSYALISILVLIFAKKENWI